ncbi:MAG: YqeG family HAD IIIA-type phosphatase [bacterium]
MKYFKPNEYVRSIYDIDLQRLQERGIKGIILDLDDTLASRHNRGSVPPKAVDWVNKMKNFGFNVCLISNALEPSKVQIAAKTMGVPSLTVAFKPLPFSLMKALNLLDAPPKKVAMIGDQIFTDVLGGKWLGMYTILVDPISEETFLPRKMMRWLEGLAYPRPEEPYQPYGV